MKNSTRECEKLIQTEAKEMREVGERKQTRNQTREKAKKKKKKK